MADKLDQQDVEQIERILNAISDNAYEVIRMVITLEQEYLHKPESAARNAVREEMVKKVEGIA